MALKYPKSLHKTVLNTPNHGSCPELPANTTVLPIFPRRAGPVLPYLTKKRCMGNSRGRVEGRKTENEKREKKRKKIKEVKRRKGQKNGKENGNKRREIKEMRKEEKKRGK